MAREVVMRCDAAFTVRVKDCGENHDNTRTCRIQVDGDSWDIDLGGPHLEALLAIAHKGRKVEGAQSGRAQDQRSLNRRIRNVPPVT